MLRRCTLSKKSEERYRDINTQRYIFIHIFIYIYIHECIKCVRQWKVASGCVCGNCRRGNRAAAATVAVAVAAATTKTATTSGGTLTKLLTLITRTHTHTHTMHTSYPRTWFTCPNFHFLESAQRLQFAYVIFTMALNSISDSGSDTECRNTFKYHCKCILLAISIWFLWDLHTNH